MSSDASGFWNTVCWASALRLFCARLLRTPRFLSWPGATVVPSSLALIISHFEGTEQGKAIGRWTAWTGIAFVVGPLLGGFMVDALSWRLIFAINVLPIAVTLWLMRGLAQDIPAKDAAVDSIGALLCALGLGAAVYALIEQSHYGWTSPLIYGPLTTGLAALAAFIWYENQTKQPMLPLGLFAKRNFGFGNLATFAVYAGLSVATFIIAVFLQQVAGYSALQAGLALLPVTIIMFFLSPRAGALSAKFGARLFMTAGPLIGALGFLYMLRVGASPNYVTQVFPGIVIFGLGLATTVSPLTSAILGAVEPRRAGIASAVNNAVARIAGLLAVAALGVIVGSTLNVATFHKALVFTALLLTLGGLISLIGIRSPRAAPQNS
jgi:MFS family permease